MNTNECPGNGLVSITLKGSNYHSWSRPITVALRSKNKIAFVDGSLPKPAANDAMFPHWDRCNTMVVSWINLSLEPEIRESVMYIESAAEIWGDLKERYYQGDIFRIAELQEEMYSLKQGDISVTAYFTHLKTLWQELENFRPIPSCTCQNQCSCQLVPTIKGCRNNDYVIRFLKGLNEQYSSVRSQIMLMEPLPSINKVFCLLIQQERQKGVNLEEPKVIANVTDNNGNGRGSYNNHGRGAGRGRGQSFKVCSFCNKTGHTIDVCYKKHGYPPNYKKYSNINNCTSSENHIEDNANDHATVSEINPEFNFGFTPEQHKAILALLQKSNNQSTHNINQITSVNQTGTSCIVSNVSKPNYWILDTGATYHVCYSLSEFQRYNRIKPIIINLPDGSKLNAQIAGTVFFSENLYLTNVLYIPSFKFNIISVSKLTKDLNCKVTFSSSMCQIQDMASMKMTGAADIKAGLYAVMPTSFVISSIHSVNNFYTYTDDVWHIRLGHLSHQKFK